MNEDTPANMDQFIKQTISLLPLEQTAERNKYDSLRATKTAKQLEILGLSINHLRVQGKPRVGSLGKIIVTLGRTAKFANDPVIPVGSIVRVRGESIGNELRGFVQTTHESSLDIALSGDSSSVLFTATSILVVELIPDDTSIKRTSHAVMNFDPMGRWARLFSGQQRLRVMTDSHVTVPLPVSLTQDLNPSQHEAVQQCMRALDICVIHGPPGTGKTHTLARLIQCLVASGKKLLVCAPSNVAVDNILIRVAHHDKKLRLLRLGAPSRLDAAVMSLSMDAIMARSNSGQIIKEAREELTVALQSSTKSSRRESTLLRQEIKKRERAAMKQCVLNSDVVFATTIGAGQLAKMLSSSSSTRFNGFDTLIVDEAAQGTMASMFVPLEFVNPENGVLILAGDHLQLGPTVLSDEALQGGLGRTLMNEIIKIHGATTMLQTQYRMHADIAAFSSKRLYGDQLVADVSCRDWTLHGGDDEFNPLVFIDTSTCEDTREECDDERDEAGNNMQDEGSRRNPGEACIVASWCLKLLTSGACPGGAQDVAVITPYSAQVALLKTMFAGHDVLREVQVKTVDGFQGQEKEAIVLSLVRSNTRKIVGFLSDQRRLNVAVTRAKKHLCVVGDAKTLTAGDAFLGEFVSFLRDNGDVLDATHELNEARKEFELPRRDTGGNKQSTIPPVQKKTIPPIIQQRTDVLVPPPPAPRRVIKHHVENAVSEPVIGPSFSFPVEEDHVSDEGEEQDDVVTNHQPSVTTTTNKKKKNKNKPLDSTPTDSPSDEFDAIINQAVKFNTTCAYKGCGKKLDLLSFPCAHCKSNFCAAHRLFETHSSECAMLERSKTRSAHLASPALSNKERVKAEQRLHAKREQARKDRTRKSDKT